MTIELNNYSSFFFFFNDTATTEIYTLSLHDALPISVQQAGRAVFAVHARPRVPSTGVHWRSGLVVTAHHTVQGDEEITVTSPDGRAVPATGAGREPALHNAGLQAHPAEFPAEIGKAHRPNPVTV